MSEEKKNIEEIKDRISRIKDLLKESRDEDLRILLDDVEPEDVAELLIEFSAQDKLRIFYLLDIDNAAVVLDDTDSQTRLQILQQVDNERLSEILEEMPMDEAADIVEEVPEKDREEILDLMEEEDAEEVEEILSYPEDSAGRVMNPSFISVEEEKTVEDAIQNIRDLDLDDDEQIFYIYVVSTEMRLKGIVPIGKLLISPKGTLIKNILDDEVHFVLVDSDQEQAALVMKKYDLFSLPVVDDEGRLVGRITADDIIDVMDEEHAEDISRMTGTIEEEEGTESTLKATQNRLPWLMTCMLGSIGTGIVIQQYEVTIAGAITLVSFIPVITATGGNSGVQASTVVVREIALGRMKYMKVFDEVWRQFKIALGLGVICGTVLSVLAHFWKKDSAVGLIVGLSLFLVVVWSNFVGVVTPIIFRRLKIDPAIAAGPLITTLNDVVGVFIYLSIAATFLK